MNVLRLPDYRAWLVADTATALTNSVRVVALPLLAFHLTGSTLQAGVLASVTSAVGVMTSLAGGVLVDSVDRRRVMLWYAAGGTLVWGLGSVLLWQGWLTFALLMVLQVGSTINGGLFGVGSNAALRSIVADEEYPQAMAANQARDSVIGIVGGPLGGVLYSWTMVAPFVASVVGYLAMALGVLRIRTDLRPNAPDEAREAVPAWRGMSAGFTFLWTNTVVRSFALIALVVNFAGALIFTATNLYLVAIGTEPTLIGLVDSIAGAAMLLGAVAAGWVVSRIPTGWLTVATVAWMAAATALIAIVPSYGGIAAGLALCVLPIPTVNAALMGYTFTRVPVSMQGRAQTALGVLGSGLAALAPVLVGYGLQRWGMAHIVWVGTALLAVATLLAVVFKPVRSVGKPSEWQAN